MRGFVIGLLVGVVSAVIVVATWWLAVQDHDAVPDSVTFKGEPHQQAPTEQALLLQNSRGELDQPNAEQKSISSDLLAPERAALRLKELALQDYPSALAQCQANKPATIYDCELTLLSTLGRANLSFLESELALIADSAERSKLIQALYRELVTDADSMTQLSDMWGEPPSFGTLDWIARELAQHSPEIALRLLAQQAASLGIQDIAESLGRQLAGEHADNALAMVDSLTNPSVKRRFLQGVKRELARQDPLATLTAWLSSQALGDTQGSINTAFFYLAQQAPQTAFGLWDQIEDSNTRYQVVSSIISSIGETDFDMLANWVLGAVRKSAPNGLDRHITRLAELNPDTTRALIKSNLSGEQRDNALGLLAVQAASGSPTAALAEIALIQNRSLRSSLESRILYQWARTDIRAAIEWGLDNQDSLAGFSLSQLINRRSGLKLDEKLGLLSRLNDRERQNVVYGLGREVANLGSPAEINALLDSQMGTKHYATLVASTVRSMSATDLNLGLQIADAQPSEFLRDLALNAILENTRQLDRNDVMQVWDQLALETTKRRAVGSIVFALSEDDPDFTLEWLSEMEMGAVRDAGVSSFIVGNVPEANEETLDLAKTIADNSLRSTVTASILFRLAPQESRMVLSEARSAGLPDSVVEQLQALIDECDRFGEDAPECNPERFMPAF